jgi:hypothetical protein
MSRRSIGIASTVCALGLWAPAGADAGSLYSGPGPRPGPDILYEPPATAPQLTNTGIWHADPILISGASAYRDGEFLYQDYLYDDHGAKGNPDPNDPRFQDPANYGFSQANGTYTYPNQADYAGNAADLVELRVKPLVGSTAFRITLNTLKDPALVGATIAIGNSDAPRPLPYGANTAAPARYFLTVHGAQADLRDAATGEIVGPAPTVAVDLSRRQIEVRVPHSAWDPGRRNVRLAAGVGLWDGAHDRYLTPGDSSSASQPGGAGGLTNPTAFFNAAFRYDEPWQHPYPPDSVFSNPAWWRDREQGADLKAGTLTPFHARVDFGKLEDGVDDELTGRRDGVPTRGPMDRILASHFAAGQGVDWTATCGGPDECIGELRGQLQPYAIYIPRGAPPAGGWGLTLLLHSLAANYNQFSDTRNQSQFGERDPGSIVITPAGRGPDGWYFDRAGADTFEVWADVASRFSLNPGYTAISGYSMGGYGTYKFATQYPDLFARAQPTVGPPADGIWVPPAPPVPGGDASNTNRMLASVRNVPFLIWDGAADELVPLAGAVAQAQTFDDLGYRYTFDVFTAADHFALATNDWYAPAADFLGKAKVNRNPPHVTYAVNPTMDFPDVGTVADHAYWLSDLRLRDGSGDAPLGTIDARSEGFGKGDPPPQPTQNGAGVLTGGNNVAMPYVEKSKSWGTAPAEPVADVLHLDAENIAAVTVNVARARLGCDVHLDVTTDGPLTVHLEGCGKDLSFP